MDLTNAKLAGNGLECVELGEKGLGLIATRPFKKDELMFRDEPLFQVCFCSEDEKEDMTARELLAAQLVTRYPDVLKRLFGPIEPQHSGRTTHKPKDTSDSDWEHALSIIDCNIYSFSMPDSGPTAEGFVLLPFLSLANHSCRPNAAMYGNSFWALRNIKQGEEITVCYGGDHFNRKSYKNRQDYLFKSWKFTCGCELCAKQNSQT